MKLFLDDIRVIDPSLGYHVARNYDSCVEFISSFRNLIEVVSLDYSLGEEKTGYDVLVFMNNHNINPKHINIHSDHSEGVPKMKKYLDDNFPNTVIKTVNRL